MAHAHFRLDWLREAERLQPYFDGKPGVVRIDFDSEDAAVGKFNHFIKEQFQNGNGKGQWLSLRLDDEWSTTHALDDKIFVIARKLEEAGIVVDWKQGQSAVGNVASGNEAGGDINITISDSVNMNGTDTSPKGVQNRLGLVCDAMRQFINNGGHFMLIINDMKRRDQGKVWKSIWHAGLQDAGGDALSLVYYVGPECKGEPHEDAPAADVLFKLPDNIETDETRKNDVFNDVVEILTSQAGYSAEAAESAACMLVDSSSDSVKRLHMGLSKAMMNLSARKNGASS